MTTQEQLKELRIEKNQVGSDYALLKLAYEQLKRENNLLQLKLNELSSQLEKKDHE